MSSYLVWIFAIWRFYFLSLLDFMLFSLWSSVYTCVAFRSSPRSCPSVVSCVQMRDGSCLSVVSLESQNVCHGCDVVQWKSSGVIISHQTEQRHHVKGVCLSIELHHRGFYTHTYTHRVSRARSYPMCMYSFSGRSSVPSCCIEL